MKIKIKDLCKSFGNLTLFNHLTLEIPEKEITCIYGTSGCGKTTLLDIIGFIETYQSGKIFYDGKQVKNKASQRKMLRDNIGFIFQDFGLIENETIISNLKIVKKIKKMPHKEKKIKKVLNSLQLDMDLNRKVYELSGGEQQRLAIAKIILKDPDLILADEPTASLDVGNKEIILNLLKSFAANGKTVIIVTHDKDTIEIADNKIDLSKAKEGIVYE